MPIGELAEMGAGNMASGTHAIAKRMLAVCLSASLVLTSAYVPARAEELDQSNSVPVVDDAAETRAVDSNFEDVVADDAGLEDGVNESDLVDGLEDAEADTDIAELEEAEESALGSQAGTIASGTWGTCPWEISTDGTLTVHPGKGADTQNDASPWADYCESVTSVRFVSEGGRKVVFPNNSSFLFFDFRNCATFDLSGCDTSSVSNMGAMFHTCDSVKQLDLSGFDMSSVDSIQGLLVCCGSLESVDFTGWDTSAITDMAAVFEGCSSLTSLDLSNWNTSRVTKLGFMFFSCYSLETLDISSWDTSSIPEPGLMGAMFERCSALESVKVGPKYQIKIENAFPEATAENGKWWSTADRKWYTRDEIVSKRSGIADAYTSVETAPEFPDVKPGSWYEKVVYRAASLGLVAGYEDGSFGPDDNITRGQVAVILWRMAGLPSAGSSAKSFSDVKPSAYYSKAVAWASSVGVVSGYADGRFGPDDKVTREQLAVMLANYAKRVGDKPVSGSTSDYASMKDAGKVASYAQSAVGWCFKNKILSGSNGNVLPKGNATRAQAAKMLVGVYDLVQE